MTRLISVQLLLYLDAVPCICSQIDSFCPKSMRLLVQGPNRHTKLAEELQGAVAPRDDAIVRLPYTGQDFWRILYFRTQETKTQPVSGNRYI